MECVFVEAYRGSERIPGGTAAMSKVQFAVDQRLQGRSSWLRVVRELNPEAPPPAKANGPGGATVAPPAKIEGVPRQVGPS